MKDFSGWRDLVAAMAKARAEARENAPRDSNDHLEAGMFLGMLRAFDQWMQRQPDPVEEEPVQEPPAVVTEETPPPAPEPPVPPAAPETDDAEPAATASPGGPGPAGDAGQSG